MFSQYLLVGLAYLLRSASSEATQTIASLDDYQRQRSCALPCFWSGDPDDLDSTDILGRSLQCCAGTPCRDTENSCFCRPDLRVSVSSFLSGCVAGRCENNADFSTAMNIYDDYCEGSDGAASVPAKTDATATGDSGGEAGATGVDRGPGNQATVTVTASGSSRSAVVPWSGAFLVLGFSTLLLSMS